MLAERVARYPNVVLVDWHAASADHPELFRPDGIHLRPAGARLYADLVAAAINAP
jgi:lysophospholipase L1-like esterase